MDGTAKCGVHRSRNCLRMFVVDRTNSNVANVYFDGNVGIGRHEEVMLRSLLNQEVPMCDGYDN
jgi:hypothetical protein